MFVVTQGYKDGKIKAKQLTYDRDAGTFKEGDEKEYKVADDAKVTKGGGRGQPGEEVKKEDWGTELKEKVRFIGTLNEAKDGFTAARITNFGGKKGKKKDN